MRTRREIEGRVEELLAKHSVTGPAVDVEALAISEGLPVIEHPFPGDVSGALIRSEVGSAIAVNGSQHVNRIRFTIAHELAHFLLEHTGDNEDHVDWDFSIIRRDTRSSTASDVREIEANMFAANVLMPRSFLDKDIALLVGADGKVQLPEERTKILAARYRVSETAMSFRLINLGYKPPY
ncbi:ImmA/IrrE family metallo-endopeptidase [soil metagenome]